MSETDRTDSQAKPQRASAGAFSTSWTRSLIALFPKSLSELNERIPKPVKAAFISTIIFGLLAHAFCWTNTLFFHDSLLIVQDSYRELIQADRAMQIPYIFLRGTIVAPWLVGTLGLLFLAIANSLVVFLLGIRKSSFAIMICAILSTCTPIILLNATFIKDFDIDMLALLLAIVAVLLTARLKWGFIGGVCVLAISLGMYSAYMSVTATLLVACILRLTLQQETKVTGFVVKAIITLVGGILLYLGYSVLIHAITGISADSYNAATAPIETSLSPVALCMNSYLHAFQIFTSPETHLVKATAILNAMLLVVALACLVKTLIQKRDLRSVVLSAICLILLPLAMNLIYIADRGLIYHSLMIYANYYWYAIALMIIDMALPHCIERLRTATSILCSILCLAISFNNVVYANQVYLTRSLQWQSSLTSLSQLYERVAAVSDYVPGETPVCFFELEGFQSNPVFEQARTALPPNPGQTLYTDNESDLTDSHHWTKYALGIDYLFPVSYFKTIDWYWEYVLGKQINTLNETDLNEAQRAFAEQMPTYPKEGSIKMVDGALIVKLS